MGINDELEIDLKEWLRIINKKIWTIILCSIICGVGAFFYFTCVASHKYSSYIDLYVTNTASTTINASNAVTVNDLNASQKLVNTYKIILQTEEATGKLLANTGLELSSQELLESLRFSTLEDTEVLRITASTEDPYVSAQICNGYGEIAPSVLNDVVEGGSVKVLTEARPKGAPSSPNVKLYTLAAFAFGFIAAAAYYILADIFSNKVKSDTELAERLEMPVIGTVPDFFSIEELNVPRALRQESRKLVARNEANAKLLTEYTILRSDSPFVVVEAYDMIHTNLRFSMATSDSNIVLVASSLPNECKTTTSLNTAISAAISGMKVLLIDGDLRNPTIHRILKKSNKNGLSRIIAGFDDVEDAIIPGPQPGLDVLTAGPTPPNPSTLIGSDSMGNLLKKLSAEYDLIIVDMPPINIFADVMTIEQYTSGIILAVREGKTKYSDIFKAISKINSVQGNVLGIVVTDSERMTGGYGDYRYGYSYRYGN